MSAPYIGFGNDTLGRRPELHEGDEITCPSCGERHTVEEPVATDGTKGLLGFYKCGDTPYLAAVAGRSVIGTPSDVHGDVDL